MRRGGSWVSHFPLSEKVQVRLHSILDGSSLAHAIHVPMGPLPIKEVLHLFRCFTHTHTHRQAKQKLPKDKENIQPFYLTYILTFFLAFYLAFFLAFYLSFYLAVSLTFFLTYILAFLLAFYLSLTFDLAFHLTFYLWLRSGREHCAMLSVEVWQEKLGVDFRG